MHWLAGSSIRVMTQQVASTEPKFYRVDASERVKPSGHSFDNQLNPHCPPAHETYVLTRRMYVPSSVFACCRFERTSVRQIVQLFSPKDKP